MTDVAITELLEIDPSRVDAVGSPANGTEWLVLKALDGEVVETNANTEEVLLEVAKADSEDDGSKCDACDGSGKIMEGNRNCPKCRGTGTSPKIGQTEKELLEEAANKMSTGAAASGVFVPPAVDCPTCKGVGKIPNGTADGADCPDCEGTGKDGSMPPMNSLNTMDGFPGAMQVGDPREFVDKAEMSSADQNDLPDSAFAHIEAGGKKDNDGKTVPRSLRHFPIHDAAHVRRNALARASQSPHGDAAMPKIKAAAKKFGIEVGKGLVEKDGTVSGVNPFLGATVSTDTTTTAAGTSSDDDANAPGSPEWEAVDADCATQAAQYLMQASELIQQFAEREGIEVAAGEGNDLFDTWDAECALDAVTAALGVMARLAFHEGMAAQKSEGVAEKSGKRLSTKSVTALAAARDHLSTLLGDDDPAKASDDDDATTKAILAKEIEDMTGDELTKVLDGRDEKLVKLMAKAIKKGSKPDMDVDHSDSIANAKMANAKGKSNKKKVAVTDNTLEDEADQGDNESASNGATGAAKAEKRERTPEEIEARKQIKKAKKMVKNAKRLEKKAAKEADLAKALESAVEKDRESLTTLQTSIESRLQEVEKMAAPGAPAKTRTPDVAAKATQRDALQLEIDRFDRMAKDTPERELSAGYKERAKQLRTELANLSA